MESIYDIYRTSEKINFLKYELFTKYDKLIEDYLSNQKELDRSFYLLLLDELIKIPSKDIDISLNKKFKRLRKNYSNKFIF